MSDAATGILYTEHTDLARGRPIPSLWSYETHVREPGRPSVTRNARGNPEFWLDRSDPLLNTMLPGNGVSLIINLGAPWTAGRSLATSALLPDACVIGPVTQSRILHVGRPCRAVGAGVPATLASALAGVPAAELVDRIIPLDDLWPRADVERLVESLAALDLRRAVASLAERLVRRLGRPSRTSGVGAAPQIIEHHAGRVSISALAASHRPSRKQFARRFVDSAGLPPKLFARIARFQTLVQGLLATDVGRWASLSSSMGFYDQAHMINEFRGFAGAPPTVFFRPHGGAVDPSTLRVSGRPSEWVRRDRNPATS
jgi:AraC-like DNA-binding protein